MKSRRKKKIIWIIKDKKKVLYRSSSECAARCFGTMLGLEWGFVKLLKESL